MPNCTSSAGPNRAARPLSRTAPSTVSTGPRSPRGKLTPAALHAATSVTASSGSNRISAVASAPTSRAISSLTAGKHDHRS
jgi:hypothetical protein